MNRTEAIKSILDKHPDAAIIFCNGLNSRETVYQFESTNHLYLLHAMGEALSVGVGIKLALPDLEVVVVDGDGNAIMGASSWSYLPIDGLYYYILDNSVYETTGGQKVPNLIHLSYADIIKIDEGKLETPIPPNPQIIIKKFKKWIQSI